MKRLIFIGGAMLVCGCSSMMKSSPNKFVVEKRWVRGTNEQEYLGGRRIHRFSPILTENLVIAANSIDGLVAYDRKTAALRWRMEIKDGAEAGAVLAEDALYFGAGDGQFYAVQVDSGKLL